MNTETKHTPGRLHLIGSPRIGFTIHGTLPDGGDTFALASIANSHISAEGNDANAARIVACWNATLDMADPGEEIAQLKADKTELVEGLRRIQNNAGARKWNSQSEDRFDLDVFSHIEASARALLAKHSKVTT